MKFFASRNQNGHFEQVFAISHDDLAVKWRYDQPGWQPLTPSRKLARQVADDASLELLDEYEQERLWALTEPPRNFSLGWRTEQRWSGWISVGLLFLPCIPLWFFWEDLVRWSGGYSETVAGVVIFSQVASLLLLKEPLMRRMVKLSKKLDARRGKRHSHKESNENPAQDTLLESLCDKTEERFHKLAVMGAELARLDAEQNLRVRREQMEKAREADAGKVEMRFFMVGGFNPALEPRPGYMLLLTDDGSWASISPREVLADERSREVSEQKFRAVVRALDCAMPDNPEYASLPDTPSRSSIEADPKTRSSAAAMIYLREDARETFLESPELQRIAKARRAMLRGNDS